METVDAIRNHAMQLPPGDRAALARDLLLSLEKGDFPDDSWNAWATEIEARSAAVAAGKFSACDWRESLQRLRDDLQQRHRR